MPYTLVRVDVLTRAAQVRDMHADGRQCEMCKHPPRCELLAIWWPLIVQLRADALTRERLS